MPVQLAIANIALDTASVSRQGFGTILFVGKHNYFSERTRTYTSTLAMSEDGIPTDSNIYLAAQGAFSQNPKPTSIKIGRQETTSVLTPVAPVTDLEYKVTLTSNGKVATEYSYTALVGDVDQEDIVDAVKALIDADTAMAAVVTTTKVGVGADAVLELSQTVSGTDWFTVSLLTNLTESFKALSTETASETISRIQLEDDEWYYFTAEDHSTTFISGAAAYIEAQLKFYRFSTSDVGSYANPVTGALQDISTNNYFRSSGIYHHEADSKFPEVAALAEIVPFVTGTVTYANRRVAAISPSLNADGNAITTTQQNNIKSVNGDYFARVGKFASDPSIIVVGRVAGGEWIDNIVTRDNMQVDIEADFTNFLINQKASKVAYNTKGLNQCRSVLQNTLTLYTADGIHNFIEPDFEITISDIEDIPDADKAARVLKQITFVATLTGAIHMVEITGTLTL